MTSRRSRMRDKRLFGHKKPDVRTSPPARIRSGAGFTTPGFDMKEARSPDAQTINSSATASKPHESSSDFLDWDHEHSER
jgi:hypothetical protein